MAIFQSVFLSPNNIEVDATQDATFSGSIRGTICNGYRILIKDLSNVTIYDSGNVALGSPLYNGDTLSVVLTGGSTSMVNGTDYKWSLTTYEDVGFTISAITDEKRFFARTTPIVTISNFVDPVTVRNYIFTGSYTQAESVDLKYFEWKLYNSNNELIEDTGRIYNANIQFDYNLYLDGQDYFIELIVENQNGTIVTTTPQAFSVVYTFPVVSFNVSATNNPDDDSILLDWGDAVQISGEASGSFAYLIDTPFVGTNSVDIQSGFITYEEQNGEQLNLNNNNTLFEHINFDSDIYLNSNNTLSGTGWSIDGVLAIQEISDGANNYIKILAFELDSFILYTQFSVGGVPVLVNEYRVYGPLNKFVLQPTAIDDGSFYIWDDADVWNDSYFWVDGEDINQTWWKLTWISPSASTHELVWQRSVDS